MQKRPNLLWVIMVVFFLFTAVALFNRQNNVSKLELANNASQQVNKINKETEKNTASFVEILFSQEKKITGQSWAKNAFEALDAVAKENNLTIKTKKYDFGILVEGIGSVINSKESYWMFAVNGKPGEVAADRYLINPGDTVVWEYKKITQ